MRGCCSHYRGRKLSLSFANSEKRFVTKTYFPRSSSPDVCSRFAAQGGPDLAQAEGFNSATAVDSASCFLDINSDGDVITRALDELDLSKSVELISAGGCNGDSNQSKVSCDTAELLKTPFPYVAESDHEHSELPHSSAEAQNSSAPEQDQWAALSVIHKAKSQECSEQVSTGLQPLADTPTTSTPKKPKGKECTPSTNTTQILEGRIEGSGYHRDGTRVGRY